MKQLRKPLFGIDYIKMNYKMEDEIFTKEELIKALRDVAVKHMNELSEEPKEEKFKPLAQELFNIKNTEDVINTGAYTPFKKDNKKSFEDIQKELNLVPKMSTEEIKIEAEWGMEQIHGRQLFPENDRGDGFYYCRIQKTA